MTFRTLITVWLVIVTGLAAGSVISLMALAHDQPLHRTYACQFTKDFRHEVNLPPAPCQYPLTPACHFDGGGAAVAGSVTLTDTGRWYCNGDGQLTPWHRHIPDVRNNS